MRALHRRTNVLIACEYSGTVRDAFLALGHNAISCDLIPTESPGPHHQGDVLEVIADPERFFGGPIHLMIAHPPCTFMSNSGAKHLYKLDAGGHTVHDKSGQRIPNALRWRDLVEAAEFFRALWEADVPHVAVENPVMTGHAKEIIGRGAAQHQTQTVHPWQFGHTETKQTCLWVRGLPPLMPTEDCEAATYALPYVERARVHNLSPSPDRGKLRSLTYTGIANAMAEQWGAFVADEVLP